MNTDPEAEEATRQRFDGLVFIVGGLAVAPWRLDGAAFLWFLGLVLLWDAHRKK